MANLSPEIGRMFRAHDKGQKKTADTARDRALAITDTILGFSDVSLAGREEWTAARNLIEGYAMLDEYSRKVLENFGQPFSLKFMSQYNN